MSGDVELASVVIAVGMVISSVILGIAIVFAAKRTGKQ